MSKGQFQRSRSELPTSFSDTGAQYLLARKLGFTCIVPDIATVVSAYEGVADCRLGNCSRLASAVLGLRGLLALIACGLVSTLSPAMRTDLRQAMENAHAQFPRPQEIAIEASDEGFGCAIGLLVQALLHHQGANRELLEASAIIGDRVDRVARFASRLDVIIRDQSLAERGDLIGRKVRAAVAWQEAAPSAVKH